MVRLLGRWRPHLAQERQVVYVERMLLPDIALRVARLSVHRAARYADTGNEQAALQTARVSRCTNTG